MTRRAAEERGAFAESMIMKIGHKNHPFHDDPNQ